MLRDGSSVLIGPLFSGEDDSIISWFASRFAELSPEKLFARSLLLLQWLDPYVESRRARKESLHHEAITALAPDGVLVGIARLLGEDRPGNAEVTVAIADAWRGRGLASVLLDGLAARARAVGIVQLSANCLASELALIGLLSRLGPTTVALASAGRVDLRIQLI
ncbi:MAG: GNAT family N-acetyltransferase [Solirubrobacteraceae bacterium]